MFNEKEGQIHCQGEERDFWVTNSVDEVFEVVLKHLFMLIPYFMIIYF
jgi:hypothetical protein